MPPPDAQRPIVVLDEVRIKDIYGDALERLGRPVLAARGLCPDAILNAHPAALVLSREWTPEWRLAAAAARRVGVPVIYVYDGVVEWSYLWNNLSAIRPGGTMLQPLIASDLCVIGRHQARIFAGLGLAERIHVVGLPRFDHLSRARYVTHGEGPRLLVATPRTVGHHVEQQVLALRALRDLRDWLATQPSIQTTWRISADLAEELGVRAEIEGSLDEALSRHDALISFTSTCLLEAMHKGIPAAQIDYRPAPLYVATAWEIRAREHIPAVIQELLYPPPEKLAWQDACYSDELEEGDATSRLVEVLREAVSRAEPYASRPTPGDAAPRRYGRLDYRQVHPELSAFALQDQSVLQYELSATLGSLRSAKTEKELLQRECVRLAEAFAGCDIADLRAYAFVERIGDAKVALRPPGLVEAADLRIHGRGSRAIYLHPPANLRFTVPTGAPGRLTFAIGLHPDVWEDTRSGPCRFALEIDGKPVFSGLLDPRQNPDDRRWHWADLAVEANANGHHLVEFQTQGVGEDMFRWAFWRNPVFLWIDPEGPPAFRPRAAEGYDFYIPGFTVPI